MVLRPRAALAALALAATAAACERAPRPDAEPATPPPVAEPAAADPSLRPVEIEPGIAIAVRRTASRAYTFYGATDRVPELRLSVEDGHNILFGPAAIPVVAGRFRADFLIEPTDRDHIFFYVTDGEGGRLAVVPVDTARELTSAGPAEMLPAEPPPLEPAAMGDRRTRVTAAGLESPHFRVRWPQVREGELTLHLVGETDLSLFRAEVRRHDRVLAMQRPRVVGSPSAWNAFATELRVPGGLREGDAVVLAPPSDGAPAELVFQPIRN
jgi:hypothetical protein